MDPRGDEGSKPTCRANSHLSRTDIESHSRTSKPGDETEVRLQFLSVGTMLLVVLSAVRPNECLCNISIHR